MRQRKVQLGAKTFELEKNFHGVSTKLEQRPGGWWILSIKLADGKKTRIRGVGLQKAHQLWAQINGESQYGSLIQSHYGEAEADTDTDFVVQFPGKVRKVLVASGKEVESGESLVLIEAMKMEFAIKAPCQGRVEKIHVKPEQQVSPGDLLLDFSKETSGS